MKNDLSKEQKQDMVLLYHSGELSVQDAEMIEAMLSEDEELLEFFESLDEQKQCLGGLELGDEFSVSQEVLAELQEGRERTVKGTSGNAFWGLGVAAAVVIGLAIWQFSGTKSPDSSNDIVEQPVKKVEPVDAPRKSVVPRYLKKRNLRGVEVSVAGRGSTKVVRSQLTQSRFKKVLEQWKTKW